MLSNIETFRELYDGATLYHEVDNVDGLTGCLEVLLSDESRREALAQTGRNLVEKKYTMRSVMDTRTARQDIKSGFFSGVRLAVNSHTPV